MSSAEFSFVIRLAPLLAKDKTEQPEFVEMCCKVTKNLAQKFPLLLPLALHFVSR